MKRLILVTLVALALFVAVLPAADASPPGERVAQVQTLTDDHPQTASTTAEIGRGAPFDIARAADSPALVTPYIDTSTRRESGGRLDKSTNMTPPDDTAATYRTGVLPGNDGPPARAVLRC